MTPPAGRAVAEVQDALATYKLARNESTKARVTTDKEREAASALCAEARALAVDIYDTAEFFYRKEPSTPSRREKRRR